MHTALLCLDYFAQSKKELPVLSGIKVNFLKPIYVGDTVTFSITRQNPLCLGAEVAGIKVMTMDLTMGSQCESWTDKNNSTVTEQLNRTPRVKSFADIEKASGIMEKINLSDTSEKFPESCPLDWSQSGRCTGGFVKAGGNGMSRASFHFYRIDSESCWG